MDLTRVSGRPQEIGYIVTAAGNSGRVNVGSGTANTDMRILGATIFTLSPFPADSTSVALYLDYAAVGGANLELISPLSGARENFPSRGSQVSFDGGQAGAILLTDSSPVLQLDFQGTGGDFPIGVFVLLRVSTLDQGIAPSFD